MRGKEEGGWKGGGVGGGRKGVELLSRRNRINSAPGNSPLFRLTYFDAGMLRVLRYLFNSELLNIFTPFALNCTQSQNNNEGKYLLTIVVTDESAVHDKSR